MRRLAVLLSLLLSLLAASARAELSCTDGLDDDGNGLTDCADPDCGADPACLEAGNCTDGVDNDLDGSTDCADTADCGADTACHESDCANGVDDDGDGATDCADTADCGADPGCFESDCTDGIDNDGNGLTDCEEAACFGPACPEVGHCANTLDDDGDTLADCADPDCSADAACPENCSNAVDDDANSFIDCADPDCIGAAECPEGDHCQDGTDNDADTLVDCDDDDCELSAACPDVVRPAEVTGLRVTKSGADVLLSWDPVTLDHAGQPERVRSYRAYAGSVGSYAPDMPGGSDRIGTSPATAFTHAGAVDDGDAHYYLVSAVDRLDREGNTKPARVTAPVLSGGWQPDGSISFDWIDAQPRSQVARYRLYQGRSPRSYDTVIDCGLNRRWALFTLEPNVIYYFALTAVDRSGNESAFSNEIFDALYGTVTVRAMDQGRSVFGGPSPFNGWEPQARVEFPPGSEWTKVSMTLTVNSYLTTPCDCAGVGRCFGDEWDRTILVFLVTDESCLGGRCGGRWDATQLELAHAITPFGTDARTGPRRYTVDVTPYAPLLTGSRWIGVQIGTYGGQGWWSDVDFTFSENPATASPKPPAAGVIPLFYRDGVGLGNQAGIAPTRVTIPPDARTVKARLWVSGHGGGDPNGHPECIGPADEFCRKNTQIVVDGGVAWQSEVWRDCSAGCRSFNACGYPSCTYPRAGWCPGELTCHANAPCDQDLDLSAFLTPGEHDISYQIVDPNPGGSWVYSLALYWYP